MNKYTNKINDGRDHDRVKLYNVVPISVPFSVSIMASDLCNFRCNYCNWSTSAGVKNAKIISWDEFLIIILQIKKLCERENKKIKVLKFTGNGEPLLNKRIPDMIRYISENNLADRIEVTTNGACLTHGMSEALIDAGLTRLLISIQGCTAEKYREICGYKLDFEKFVDNVKFFYTNRKQCKIHIKTVNIAVPTEKEKNDFFNIFGSICDSINIENIMNSCEDVDYSKIVTEIDMENTRYGNIVQKKKCCDTMFMYANIDSNGNVDCCGCKYPPHYIGNVFKQPFSEIWNGEKHKHDMILHLSGLRKNIKDCRECSSIWQFSRPEDNLDEHLEEILERVKKL